MMRIEIEFFGDGWAVTAHEKETGFILRKIVSSRIGAYAEVYRLMDEKIREEANVILDAAREC